MRTRNILKILIVLVLVAVIGVAYIEPVAKSMHLGLDLKGGAHVVLEAKDTEANKVDDQDMQQLVSVIRERVDKLGVSEPTIQRQGKRRLIVELPEIKDAQRAVEVIGQTASLEFRDEQGNLILTGKDLKKAQAGLTEGNQPEVALQFDKSGTDKFAKATKENVGKVIYILLDENIISSPVVQEEIPNGRARITGLRDPQEAQNLAILLNSGALPVDLEVLEVRTVGPKLGADSIERSKTAATYGVIIVLLFMLVFYRIPGLIADIALVIYVMLVLGILAAINAVLTLPGIAGLILSIGMAVDANIIIFERLKEELALGKSLRGSIDSAFSRAFLTIVDSNITTLIAAAVLFYFGAGPIKGFAVTLTIGILASMFTALVITRFLLKAMANTGLIKSSKLYGAK